MDFNEYQKWAMRTSGTYKVDTDQLLNGALGLAGESGEVVDHLKKVLFQGHKFDDDHVVNELGDILWYVALCADALDLSLETIARLNIDKLKKRYPMGFTVEDSIKRVDTKE